MTPMRFIYVFKEATVSENFTVEQAKTTRNEKRIAYSKKQRQMTIYFTTITQAIHRLQTPLGHLPPEVFIQHIPGDDEVYLEENSKLCELAPAANIHSQSSAPATYPLIYFM
jgi:hypothetical protein